MGARPPALSLPLRHRRQGAAAAAGPAQAPLWAGCWGRAPRWPARWRSGGGAAGGGGGQGRLGRMHLGPAAPVSATLSATSCP